jgi:hypothetical protein
MVLLSLRCQWTNQGQGEGWIRRRAMIKEILFWAIFLIAGAMCASGYLVTQVWKLWCKLRKRGYWYDGM